MFCPQCGIRQSEELKFCKSCGANLYAVRQVVTTRETGEKFDWNKTWVAEMLLSQAEQKKRRRELEDSESPEEKRYNEIKAGVITSCVGVGVMVFLYIFMQGIILGGHIPSDEAEIIKRVWVAGIIPFVIGLGIIFNGLVVSKKLVETARQERQAIEAPGAVDSFGKSKEDLSLSSKDRYELDEPRPSVTENTTRQLENIQSGE